MEDWLPQQTSTLVAEWDKAIERFYPDHAEVWHDPAAQYQALTREWNTLDALQYIDWSAVMGNGGARVLDLGAGTGWLSAFLSRLDGVATIDAVDSSRRNLTEMLPGMVELMGGRQEKIRPVLGLFSPLPVPTGSYDLIVASSAIHHAPRLGTVLEECHRVLDNGGAFVILNETPVGTPTYMYRLTRAFLAIAGRVAGGHHDDYSRSVSAGGLLYDPFLGDVAYSLQQWQEAFSRTGWLCETIRTPMTSYRSQAKDRSRLTHFVLRKAGARNAKAEGGLTDPDYWDAFWEGVKIPARIDPTDSFDRTFSTVLDRYLPDFRGRALAEVGCAPGRWLAHCAERFGMQVTGFDSSPAGIEKTQKNLIAQGVEGELIAADFTTYDGEPFAFDVVMSMGLIEHFTDPQGIVDRHVRLLKPGGLLVLEVPNFSGMTLRLLRRTNSPLLAYHNLAVMYRDVLVALGVSAGVTLVEARYAGGFEPRFVDPSGEGLAFRLAFGALSRIRRKAKVLDRANSRRWSGYLYAVFRKPDGSGSPSE